MNALTGVLDAILRMTGTSIVRAHRQQPLTRHVAWAGRAGYRALLSQRRGRIPSSSRGVFLTKNYERPGDHRSGGPV